jgi:uncharacterized protein YeeX (DUF496 family)
MKNCVICCEDTNEKNLFKCKNKECEMKQCCIDCMKRYLLESSKEPHCMSCHHAICTSDFISDFSKRWRLDVYKEHKKNILWAKEQSKMTETMELIRKQNKKNKIEGEITKLEQQIREFKMEIHRIDGRYVNEELSSKTKCINEYKYKCPKEDCNGFLDGNYNCAICDTNYCKDCFIVLQNDSKEHSCNEELKASIKKIKKDAKPCPNCGEMISKISGCFAPDTKILMWDGTTKLSQHIRIGDLLVGNDGKKRTVLRLCSGEDDMYEIIQTKGENYIVNSNHILVLKYSGDKQIYWYSSTNSWKINWFDHDTKKVKTKQFNVTNETSIEQAKIEIENFKKTIIFPDIIKITVNDYLKITESRKKGFMGFTSKGINWDYQEIELDPYLLGIWLGDGTHSLPAIASNDIEIQEYLLNWCDNNDAELVHQDKFIFKIRRRNLTNYKNNSRLPIGNDSCDTCLGCSKKVADICNIKRPNTVKEKPTKKTNPFIDLLNKYNLFKNKHIPKEYMINSRDVRLKLLAGLIDSDGHVPKDNNQRIVIAQVEPILSKQIIFLAKSLGFTVNVSIVKRINVNVAFYKEINSDEKKDYRDVHYINISGTSVHEIPTILPRKKCFDTLFDHYNTGIKINKIGKGNYYGWEIDDNNLFVLNDMTVVHNCDMMFCVKDNCGTSFNWRTGQVEKGLIHNPHAHAYYERHPEALEAYNNRMRELRTNRNERVDNCIVSVTDISTKIRTMGESISEKRKERKEQINYIINMIRNIYNFRNYTEVPVHKENTDLRIKWLKNESDELSVKRTLHMRFKKIEREILDHQILSTCATVINDLLRQMLDSKTNDEFYMIYSNDIQNIINYTNIELQANADYFGLKAKQINNEFKII